LEEDQEKIAYMYTEYNLYPAEYPRKKARRCNPFGGGWTIKILPEQA
jgi:hypothetical protein